MSKAAQQEYPYRPDLKCRVISIHYDFVAQTGALQMPPDNCCDRTGCIALFESIDRRVKVIKTLAGSEPDTIYRRTRSGWEAFLPVQA